MQIDPENSVALVKEGNSSNVIVMHCLLVMRTFKLVIQITRYKISAKACRALKPRSGKHLPCAVLTSTVNFLLFLFDVAKRIVTDQLFPFFLLLFSLSILLSIEREREIFPENYIYIYIKNYIFNFKFPLSEEWETRKKKEITTTRQIETRVKRQVVLEDGEVVVDSGPLVTTNTTEDVEQQEHTTQEVNPS